jgi:hypothetical protein
MAIIDLVLDSIVFFCAFGSENNSQLTANSLRLITTIDNLYSLTHVSLASRQSSNQNQNQNKEQEFDENQNEKKQKRTEHG